jgi:hypothetical protein
MFADEPASAIPPPSVSNVAPAHGPAAGGTEVLISGANFTGATAVGFGTVAATSFRVKSAAAIEAVAPAEPAGVIDVTVTTPTGTSAATTDAQFRFTSPGSSAQPVTQASPQGLAPSGEAGSTGTLGFGPVTGGSTACSVSLLSRSVSVLHSKAAFKLRKIGAGVCRGRLTLSYSAKAAGNRLRSTSIGTAAFSISSSRNWLILVPLSRSARHLLARRHGTLSASLSILRLLPAPRQLRTSSVRLQTPRPRRTRATPSAAG